eukprot:Opistho-2@36350
MTAATKAAYTGLVLATVAAFQVFLLGSGWILGAQDGIQRSMRTTCNVFPFPLNHVMGMFDVFFGESGVVDGAVGKALFNHAVAFVGPILIFSIVETSGAGLAFASLYPAAEQFASFAMTTPIMFSRYDSAVLKDRRSVRVSIPRVLVGALALVGTAYG